MGSVFYNRRELVPTGRPGAKEFKNLSVYKMDDKRTPTENLDSNIIKVVDS